MRADISCRRLSIEQEYGPGVRTIREEVFGPHLAVVPFENDEQAIQIYNDTPYGLSMAVITEDYRRWRLYRDECDYGMGYVNLPCIGAEVHLPFGGVKRSGNGQPSAAGLVDAVTHKTAFTVNHERGITMAQGMSARCRGKRRRAKMHEPDRCGGGGKNGRSPYTAEQAWQAQPGLIPTLRH